MRIVVLFIFCLAASISSAKNIDRLLKELSSDDYTTRKRAFVELARMCPDIEESLKAAMRDADPQASFSIMKLLRLCHIRKKQARIEQLLREAGLSEKESSRLSSALYGTSRRGRLAALLAIAQKAPKTLPALYVAIEDQEYDAVLAALITAATASASKGATPQPRLFKLLINRCPKPKQPPAFVNALLCVADLSDPNVAESLRGLCRDGRELVVAEARLQLSKKPDVVTTLLCFALDPDPRVRKEVAASLFTAATICHKFRIPKICEKWVKDVLEKGEEILRHAVAAVVARSPVPWAKKMVVSFLDNPDDTIVTYGIEGVGRWRIVEAVPRLGVLVLQARFVISAAEALGRIGTKEAVEALQRAVCSSNAPYRGPIYEALIKLNPESAKSVLIGAIMRLKTPQEKREVQNYLSGVFARSFGDKDEEALLSVLYAAGRDPAAALVAANLLAQFGSKRAETALRKMLKTHHRLLVVKPYILMRGADEARRWLIRGGLEAESAAQALAVLGDAAPMLRLARIPRELSNIPQKIIRDLATITHTSLLVWNIKPTAGLLSFKRGESVYDAVRRLAKRMGYRLRTDVGFALVADESDVARFVAATVPTDGSLNIKHMLATVLFEGGTVGQALGQMRALLRMRLDEGVSDKPLRLYGVLLDVRVEDVLRLISAAGDVSMKIERGVLIVEDKK